MSPLVSIVIPCFNSGKTITKTLTSISDQTWHHIEVIVVDDGSTDSDTIETLNQLNGIRMIRQPNAGLAAARNTGLWAASGEYFLPLDADDWMAPTMIEELVKKLQSSTGASFAFAHYALEGEHQGHLKKSYNFFEQLFFNQLPYSLLMPTSLARSIGGYDITMRNGYEDWEFNIRLGKHGYFGVEVSKPLFHYRVSNTGMLLSKSSELHGNLWGGIQKKHRDIYRPAQLVKLWTKWRTTPSTYPLYFYFGWMILYKLLPESVFTRTFKALRAYSASRRLNFSKTSSR